MTLQNAELISKVLKSLDYYVDVEGLTKELQTIPNLTNEIVLSKVQNYKKGLKNRCMVCRTDIGMSNPRQLCGKWMCYGLYM